MNNEQCSRLSMWHDARTSYDRHRWAVQCISNATMEEHGELWDKSEHVYTIPQYKSSQTASDYNFAKTWATIKLECTCSSAKQWPHPTDTAHYLAKVYVQNSHRTSGNQQYGVTMAGIWYLVPLFDACMMYISDNLIPAAHALYGLLWVCDRPCTAPVIYKCSHHGDAHTKHGVARPSHIYWFK